MKLIEDYKIALQALYDHVGFQEDWVVFPIDDCTNSVWAIDGNHVKYADTVEAFESDGDYYEDDIYTQRFYNKWVYEGAELTMIFCDPHVDGMKWFRIFSNKLRMGK